MIANIALDDALILPHRANPAGSNFRERQVASALRELVAAVVIHSAGKDEPRIEVTGRLATLTGAPDLLPQQTIPPTVVAGAGIEPATYGL
jgi:hypothetical protein